MTRRAGLLAVATLAATSGVVWGLGPRALPALRHAVAVVVTPARKAPPAHRAASVAPASLPVTVANAGPSVVRPSTVLARDEFRLAGEAAPRSLQVISVPVPAELGSGPVDYLVRSVGLAELLSAREGHIDAGPPPRYASIVARVPANAAPGDLTVAEILFQGDSGSVEVTVGLVVSRIRRIVLRPLRSSLALRPGQRIELPVQVQNLGNGIDSLDITATLPASWRLEGGTSVILAPGAQAEVLFNVRAPATNGYGTVPLHLRASTDSLEVAHVQIAAEILPDASEERRQRGLNVTAGVATVAGGDKGASPTFGLQVDGPLMPGIALNGRFTATQDRDRFDAYSMARVGYFLDASYLSATGRTWRVTGGRTGYTFSPIFGWNAYGLGASGDVTYGRWTIGGLAAQEQAAGRTGGVQFGGRLAHPLGRGLLSGSVVHLEQTFAGDRRLDGGGASYAWALRPGTNVTAEVGWRRAGGTEGAAGALTFMGGSVRRHFDLYAAHAPGGSAGFARATDEFSGGYWQTLNERIAVRGYGYSMFDDPGTGARYRSRGLTAGPTVSFGSYTSVELTVNSRSTEFEGDQGTIGTTERLASVTGRTLIGQLAARATVSAGQVGRERVDTSGNLGTTSGSKVILRGGADYNTPRGLYQLDASLEKNQAVTGQIPSLGYVGVQGTSLRPFSFTNAPRFDVGLWKNIFQGAPPGAVGMRVGAEMALPGDFLFTVNAERNPYLHSGGSTPWVATIKLERGVSFAVLRRPTARGMVYDDLDGDGRRDGGEPGLAGVVVRRGDRTAVSRADGSFLFYEALAPTFVPTIESSSLAMGQVAPTLPRDSTKREWFLPVVRTGRLVVRITPTADSLARVPTTPLGELTALAADSTGAIWMAHADSTGAATFDALPPGHYTITVDFSKSTERLRMLQSAPVIEIGPGAALPDLTIRIGFRAVRVFDGGAQGAGGGRR